MKSRKLALSVVLLVSLSACSTAGDILAIGEVKPWERDVLAREDMQLVPDIMDQIVDDHIYFSKEASTGGSSAQGGGCGCN
ncbi:MAG: DUF4266 domain-containing protein [Granulosicoccus sp.]